MSQQTIESIFGAQPISLIDLFEDKADLGFRIPIYQRRYDWDHENIQRLFEDVLLGLSYRMKDENALTFLGTIILLEDRKSEEKFNGTSYKVIDGQQRLTTFTLLACVLHEILEDKEIEINKIEGVKTTVKSWLIEESENLRIQLYGLFCGELSGKARQKFPFPRLVREERDYRARTIHNYEYRSSIAKLLSEFITYIDKKDEVARGSDFDFKKHLDSKKDSAFLNAITEITKCINVVAGDKDHNLQSLIVNFPDLKIVNKPGYKSLFDCLPNDESKRGSLLSEAEKSILAIEPFIRLLLFSSFLINKVIVTRIIVTDPKYGFDIFDSLNTTGEPLTAIQTFKPKVIRYETEKKRKFSGSKSENHLNKIEDYLDSFEDKNNDRRQRAAKDLVVSFALYKTGEKCSLALNQQRRYLHNRYEKIGSISGNEFDIKQLFVRDLFNVADYRGKFWSTENIGKQLNDYSEGNKSKILLCLRFLRDIKTSLSIPILCRFYFESIRQKDKRIFIDSVLALTAFVILRRSVTSNTAGIDNDLRGLMSQGKHKPTGEDKKLCIGLDSLNTMPSVEEFKEYLKSWLGQKKIGVSNKKSWVEQVVIQPIYETSNSLCRILHLAAAHHSRVDINIPWKLSKNNARKSPETDYLSYSRWVSSEVSTVEHIAPKSILKNNDWDNEIYFPDTSLRHSLGNLTLLTTQENSLLGTKAWPKKKVLFKAFSTKTTEELDVVLDEARKDGINLSEIGKDILIVNGTHRPLASTISTVEKWTAEHIKQRSKNLAELAWDEIAPWLFEEEE